MGKNNLYLQKWLGEIKPVGSAGKGIFRSALISFIILVITFPGFYPGISLGLDGSYVYAFNYFFSNRIQLGAAHIFTYGPLVFLFAPNVLGNNLGIAIPVTCLLRFFFIYSFLLLGSHVNPANRIWHILLIAVLCALFYLIDIFLVGGVILTLLNYEFGKNKIWLIGGGILSAIAFLVKSSFGIWCFAAIFTYALYSLFRTKRPQILLYFAITVTIYIVLIWLFVYHSLSALPGYLYTNFLIVGEYSNSLQLEDTVHHWTIFFLGILFFYLTLFFTKNKLTKLLYLLSIAPLYIAFKYSFSRADIWHEGIIFYYIIMICAMALALEKKLNRFAILMLFASISLIYTNLYLAKSACGYVKGFNFDGINNFISWVIRYKSTLSNIEKNDSVTLQERILDKEQRNLIGNSTVDCYPFDYTYIPANKLNWDPRPNLQLYISTPWIDSANAAFLASDKAPQFYIWATEQPPGSNYYCDNRYLLSEDPQSTYTFFNRYRLIDFNNKTTLFERTSGKLLGKEIITSSANAALGKWIDIPPCDSNSIIRARLHFTNTLKGILRKTFYKDQIYMIDYLLSSGSIRTYRFIPANATGGLWVNPLVIDITKGLKGEQVKSIRIWVSRKRLIKRNFRIDWTMFSKL